MNQPVDLSKVLAKTDVEMERLGWTPQQGREHLIQTYGKRGRTLLKEDELLDFLRYLEYLPTPYTLIENPNISTETQSKAEEYPTKPEPIDLSEIIAKTDVEMERLGLTTQQGRKHLIQTYGKRGRILLTQEELLEFLQYLESLPTPNTLEIDSLAGF